MSAQLVLQNFMLERFLERVSLSEYRDKLIIKGGFLIASLVGLDTRATMDMDITAKGLPVTEASVRRMAEDIAKVTIGDGVTFSLKGIGEIRQGDKYAGYRVALTADCPPMSVPLKLDITTGDMITPREVAYEYRLMLEDRSIRVLAYNVATVLAEKLETVISRGDLNTRTRDCYDVFILTRLQRENIDLAVLREALEATAARRGSSAVMRRYAQVMDVVANSPVMQNRWDEFAKNFEYAADIAFFDVCDAVVEIMDEMSEMPRDREDA